MQRKSIVIALLVQALAMLGCSAGDVRDPTPGGEQSSETSSEGVVEANQCNGAGNCVPSSNYCCSGLGAVPRGTCSNYCCLRSGAHNAGDARLCCSGKKQSGNYCW
ncbi:MAG TPA: hypothetical protein VFQ35_20170 [Polyangiaceae bacterium]|nr:hypothetical protein [Polyangiaceae bacterium]